MAASHLIICLHGIGASGAQMKPIADSWRGHFPGATFVTPDAPLKNGHGGHQWFKVDGMQLDPKRIQEARGAFDTTIGDVIRREGFDGKNGSIAFVGVSQGAIVALDAVASGRWKVGALVAFRVCCRQRRFPDPAIKPRCSSFMEPTTGLSRQWPRMSQPDS